MIHLLKLNRQSLKDLSFLMLTHKILSDLLPKNLIMPLIINFNQESEIFKKNCI
jgi:hypothetical protein